MREWPKQSAEGGRHAIFEVNDQPTPRSASRIDREQFTAQVDTGPCLTSHTWSTSMHVRSLLE